MNLDSDFDPLRKPGRRGRPRKHPPGQRGRSRHNTMPREVEDLFRRVARECPARPRPEKVPRVRPAKPYADFPLHAHGNGSWARRIRGKLRYFGPWSDPDGALKTYLAQREDLLAGRVPVAGPVRTVPKASPPPATAVAVAVSRNRLLVPQWVPLERRWESGYWAGPCQRWQIGPAVYVVYEYRRVQWNGRLPGPWGFRAWPRLFRLYLFRAGHNPLNVGNFATQAEAEAAAVQHVAARRRDRHAR